MTSVSITQLKANPSQAISYSQDYPVAVQNRNDTKAYMVGKVLFEKMILYLEDIEDKKAIKNIDLEKKRDFEEFASELGL